MSKGNVTKKINHFILFCKGWYKPVNEEEELFETVRKVLYLDDYVCIRNMSDVVSILMSRIEEYNSCLLDEGNRNFFSVRKLYDFYKSVERIQQYYKDSTLTFDEKVVLAICEFFRYETINVDKPVYSRKLYKFGLKNGTWHYKQGMSYKEQNRFADEFFDKK